MPSRALPAAAIALAAAAAGLAWWWLAAPAGRGAGGYGDAGEAAGAPSGLEDGPAAVGTRTGGAGAPGSTGPGGGSVDAGPAAGAAPRPVTPEQARARAGRAAANRAAHREPPPASDKGVGEVHGKWNREDEARVDVVRAKACETFLRGPAVREHRSVGAVAAAVAAATGVAVEVEGEGIAEEPVELHGEELPAHEALMQASLRRNLWFRIEPNRIVVGR